MLTGAEITIYTTVITLLVLGEVVLGSYALRWKQRAVDLEARWLSHTLNPDSPCARKEIQR